MFLILITYKKPIEVIDKYLFEHRKFLDECYQTNLFIVAGPRCPRVGGIIVSQLNDETKVRETMRRDPFVIHDLIDYELIEFKPVRYHQDFSKFIVTDELVK
jgi:uncharacterized protein YciI